MKKPRLQTVLEKQLEVASLSMADMIGAPKKRDEIAAPEKLERGKSGVKPGKRTLKKRTPR